LETCERSTQYSTSKRQDWIFIVSQGQEVLARIRTSPNDEIISDMSLFIELIDSSLAISRWPVFVALLVDITIVWDTANVGYVMNGCWTWSGDARTLLLEFSGHVKNLIESAYRQSLILEPFCTVPRMLWNILDFSVCAITITGTLSCALSKMNDGGIQHQLIAIAPSVPKFLAGTITSYEATRRLDCATPSAPHPTHGSQASENIPSMRIQAGHSLNSPADNPRTWCRFWQVYCLKDTSAHE
jgi:hypothetical protein